MENVVFQIMLLILSKSFLNLVLNLYITDERNSQVISVVNFIPSKFGSFPQVFWKVVLHTRLNGYRESSGDSWFVTNNLLVYDTWSEARSISCTSSIFPLNLISVWPIPSQNNIHCWWIEIKKIPKYKLYDKTGDLSKTTFWYSNNDTKRNPWVTLIPLIFGPLIFSLPLIFAHP